MIQLHSRTIPVIPHPFLLNYCLKMKIDTNLMADCAPQNVLVMFHLLPIIYCQRYSYNVQAMCDANLCITYVSIAGPGGKNDICVFRWLTHLRTWLSNLQSGFYITGNNTYPLLKISWFHLVVEKL